MRMDAVMTINHHSHRMPLAIRSVNETTNEQILVCVYFNQTYSCFQLDMIIGH